MHLTVEIERRIVDLIAARFTRESHGPRPHGGLTADARNPPDLIAAADAGARPSEGSAYTDR